MQHQPAHRSNGTVPLSLTAACSPGSGSLSPKKRRSNNDWQCDRPLAVVCRPVPRGVHYPEEVHCFARGSRWDPSTAILPAFHGFARRTSRGAATSRCWCGGSSCRARSTPRPPPSRPGPGPRSRPHRTPTRDFIVAADSLPFPNFRFQHICTCRPHHIPPLCVDCRGFIQFSPSVGANQPPPPLPGAGVHPAHRPVRLPLTRQFDGLAPLRGLRLTPPPPLLALPPCARDAPRPWVDHRSAQQ